MRDPPKVGKKIYLSKDIIIKQKLSKKMEKEKFGKIVKVSPPPPPPEPFPSDDHFSNRTPTWWWKFVQFFLQYYFSR